MFEGLAALIISLRSAGHNGASCYGAFDCVVSFHLLRGAASRAKRSAFNRSRLSWKAFCAVS